MLIPDVIREQAAQEVRSLLNTGYRPMWSYRGGSYESYALRHSANGNRVIVSITPVRCVVFKNKKKILQYKLENGKMYQS